MKRNFKNALVEMVTTWWPPEFKADKSHYLSKYRAADKVFSMRLDDYAWHKSMFTYEPVSEIHHLPGCCFYQFAFMKYDSQWFMKTGEVILWHNPPIVRKTLGYHAIVLYSYKGKLSALEAMKCPVS